MSNKRHETDTVSKPSSRNGNVSRRELLTLLGSAAIAGTLPACSREEAAVTSPQAADPAPATKLPDDLHYKSIREVAGLIESREISPLELTRMMLDRIESLDGQLKSYATVTAERALASAGKAEQEIMAGGLSRTAAWHTRRG